MAKIEKLKQECFMEKDNKRPKISVVIANFNNAPYLTDTLESVRQQTFTDWEALVIDDGSTDGSPEIIDDFCKADGRFRAIYQENAGVSVARNIGLDNSLGEYVILMDSDDCFTPSALETLFVLAENHSADMVTGSQVEVGEDFKLGIPIKSNCSKEIHVIKLAKQSSKRGYWEWVHNSLFRRKTVENIRFVRGLHPHEDTLFFMTACIGFNTIVKVDEIITYYRICSGGVMQRSQIDLTIWAKMTGIFAMEIHKMLTSRCDFPPGWIFSAKYTVIVQMKDVRFMSALVSRVKNEKELAHKVLRENIKLLPDCLKVCKRRYRLAFHLFARNMDWLGRILMAPRHFSLRGKNTKCTNKIEIVFAITPNYLPYAVVTMRSILEKSRTRSICFHYLYANNIDSFTPMTDDEISHLKDTARGSIHDFPEVTIKFYDISDRMYLLDGQNIGCWGPISMAHYMYILTPLVLKDVNKIIYMDADMLCNYDISELWKIDMSRHAIGVATRNVYNEEEFNSGLIVMNLDFWRKNDVFAKVRAHGSILQHGDRLCDQYLMNSYFRFRNPAQLKYVDWQWNVLPINERFHDGTRIYHYTNYISKPWTDIHGDKCDLWWNVARRTLFYEKFVLDLAAQQKTKTTPTTTSDIKNTD
ncbi:MAG: glycosyltransferase family 2 protein [Puniceicoccales bacterium]|jgi:glycosyltransferase involved in cell wall biosynthesis/lipopolysaccharide biosynthesis glycosyltransferase|nr:glycosyltransferase family 2 protein [Puniceicoccales bacterium]